MNTGSLIYIGLNLLVTFVGIVAFEPWSVMAAGLSGLNAYGQYQLAKGGSP